MSTEGALRRAFALFDEDGSGFLTSEEFLQVLQRQHGDDASFSEQDAHELLNAMDTNGDGMVSIDEFVENFSNQGTIDVPDAVAEGPSVIFCDVDNARVSAVYGEMYSPSRTYDIVDEDKDCFHKGVPVFKIYDDPLIKPAAALEVGDPCAAMVVDKYAMRRAGHSMPIPGGWQSLYYHKSAVGAAEERV